jgi:hypothetical protein
MFPSETDDLIVELFAPGRRFPGDLSHPVMETEGLVDTHPLAADLEAGEGVNTVREDAEGSLHFLNFTSRKPAVLLARAWHVIGIPFAFEHLALYREVAAASRCTIVEISRPEAGGLEHLIFAARIAGLSDDEYLDCIAAEAEAQA